jgi:hypothetical protein
MIQVIAEHPEVVILEDEKGKFLFPRDNDEFIDLPRVPIISTMRQEYLHREARAMLN